MSKRSLVLILFCTLCLARSASSQSGPATFAQLAPAEPAAHNMALVGHVGGYNLRTIAFQGNYAYVGTAAWPTSARLVVFDVSNPARPTPVGETGALSDAINDITVAGEYAYVTDRKGLGIISIANPSAPQWMGFYDSPGIADSVEVSGDYAYVAARDAGMRVVNVANPAAPTEVGFFAPAGGSISWLVVQSHYAYLSDGSAGLRIVDVSAPSNPVQVGFSATTRYSGPLAIAGQYVYLAEMEEIAPYEERYFLRSIDITNPNNPVETDSQDISYLGGIGYKMVSVNNYLYLLTSGLCIFSLENPATPTLAGQSSIWSIIDGTFTAEYAYLVNYFGLLVINISDPTNLTPVGFYTNPRCSQDIQVKSPYAYILEDGGIQIVDISNPHNPWVAGIYYNFDEALSDFDIAGNYMYVIADLGYNLRIIDISNPITLTQAGIYALPAMMGSLVVSGSHAYLSDGNELTILDVSNPITPTQLGSFATAGSAADMAVQGDLLYIAEPTVGIQIVSISDPANPVQVRTYNTSGNARGIKVAGEYAFIANGPAGVLILNISDPANPLKVGSYATPDFASSVAVSSNHVYVADGLEGVRAIDISDLSNPKEIGFYKTWEHVVDVTVSGDYIFAANYYNGLLILVNVSDRMFLPFVSR